MSDVDDSIKTYISEEDKREIKYYGEIADDERLLKAGTYKGKIQGKTLIIGNFTFLKLPISKLIVTADESTCDQLELIIKNYPQVITTFQDTGNWYTNGEPGPEWFTALIETSQDCTKKIEAYGNAELKRIGKSANNMFWG